MFNKNRLMCRYYSTLLQWPLRRFWRWGVVLQPGEYRDTLDMKIETNPNESLSELQYVKLKFTEQEALQIWKKAFVAMMQQCDFVQIGKKGIWYDADEPVPMDDTVLRIGPDFMIVVAYADGQIDAKTKKETYLDTVFDHFGLPNFTIA